MSSARGTLSWLPAVSRLDLVAAPVAAVLASARPSVDAVASSVTEALVAAIDPELADTAAFCAAYDVSPAASANCVVVAGKRSGVAQLAACVVLATTRLDVNGLVRRHLGARKASFAPMDDAVAATGMEYGGITPIGLPPDWPLLVDAAVVDAGEVVVGSGIRGSKLLLPGAGLADLPGAEVLPGLGIVAPSARASSDDSH